MNHGAQDLDQAIRDKKLSREEAAKLLDLAPASGTINRLLSGERKPGRELAFRIEKAFGVAMCRWEMPVRARRAAVG